MTSWSYWWPERGETESDASGCLSSWTQPSLVASDICARDHAGGEFRLSRVLPQWMGLLA